MPPHSVAFDGTSISRVAAAVDSGGVTQSLAFGLLARDGFGGTAIGVRSAVMLAFVHHLLDARGREAHVIA